MPSRSHARWKPAWTNGPIGDVVGRYKVRYQVPDPTDNFTIGRTAVARPMQIRHGARHENADDEPGAVSRYANPTGFHGLYGNQVGANAWQKDMGEREPKKQTGPGVNPLRGLPFKSRGR